MSRSRVGSLGRRLSLWLALQSLVCLAVVCLAVYAFTALSLRAQQDEALQKARGQVEHALAETSTRADPAAMRHKLDDMLMGEHDLSLRLVDATGRVLYERLPPGPPAAPGQRQLRFESAVLPAEGGRVRGLLSLDISDQESLLQRIRMALLAAACVGTALVSGGGFFLVRRGLRPVRALVEQTRALTADSLHRRLDGSAQPEELEPLIEQFNLLLGRLNSAYEQLEGFNADVAHELCTPLATLISGTEVALRKARSADELRELLCANLEDLERVAGIVQDMLFLSQADRGARARRTPVDSVAALALGVSELHEAALEEAGLRIEVAGDAAARLDTRLLQRALSNLVANATRFGVPGSVVRIGVREQAAAVVVEVDNEGPAIAPEHLPRLFDRFYRADPSRSHADRNHGLGLAIVAAIARMHGGEVHARSAAGVTTIGLTIPPEAEH